MSTGNRAGAKPRRPSEPPYVPRRTPPGAGCRGSRRARASALGGRAGRLCWSPTRESGPRPRAASRTPPSFPRGAARPSLGPPLPETGQPSWRCTRVGWLRGSSGSASLSAATRQPAELLLDGIPVVLVLHLEVALRRLRALVGASACFLVLARRAATEDALEPAVVGEEGVLHRWLCRIPAASYFRVIWTEIGMDHPEEPPPPGPPRLGSGRTC